MSVSEKLAKWAKGGTAFPQRVLLYPTNRCNLRCIFCYQQLKPYDYSDVMPKEKWVAITKELCENGVEVLQISGGGEPMLVPETVLEMMRIIKRNNISGRLVNNGTVWRKEWVEETISIGWDNVIFSVDGPNALIHDKMRGVEGAFKRTTESINMFKECKERRGSQKPLLEFSTVLCQLNFEHVSEIISLAHDLGVKVITFEPVFVSNPYVHKIKLTREQRVRFMEELIPPAIKEAESFGVITNLSSLLELRVIEETGSLKPEIRLAKESEAEDNLADEVTFLNALCFEPWLWPKVEANGEIGPCSTNMLKKESIKNKTFKEVWLGKQFSEFRKAILENKLPDGCSNCVSTHIPLNKRIRRELKEYMKHG